jgi:hypothetical protein
MAVERKSVPQGLKAKEVGRWMSGLKPGPTQRLKPTTFKVWMYDLKAVPFRRMSFSAVGKNAAI